MDLRALALVAVVAFGGLLGGTGAASADQSCTFPFTATDTTGAAVTVDGPPARLVALGPSAAQTLWELGARDRVVGLPVQPYTAYLDGAEDRAPVMNENGFTVNVEAVVALEPDLVLAPNVIPTETVERLRASGLTVYRFEAAASLEDVYAKTRLTGRLVGACDSAEATVADMERRIGVVREAVTGQPTPRVLLPLGGGFVAGDATFLNEMVTVAGGRNVAVEANITGYQPVSPEVVVETDPEWLVVPSSLPRSEYASPAYNATTAVREGQVIVIDADLANQPAPRIVTPIEAIAKALHPDAYMAANATPSPSPTATPPTAEPVPTVTQRTTGTPGQPGFGITVTLAALLGAILAPRLRG